MATTVTHIIATPDTTLSIPTAAAYRSGNSKDYCIIDWISMTTNCTAACDVAIQVEDVNNAVYWKGMETLEADTATTIFCDFGGKGLPFKGALENFSANHNITIDGSSYRSPLVTATPGDGDTAYLLTVAYHWEPAPMRQS
jgi:hypothetical protein